MTDMRNTICKACGTKYHVCSNCYADDWMYAGYCSEKCWMTLPLVDRLRIDGEDEAADEIEWLQEVIASKLHQRCCHDCGHVFYAADGIVPYCLCEKCKSQDTRRLKDSK